MKLLPVLTAGLLALVFAIACGGDDKPSLSAPAPSAASSTPAAPSSGSPSAMPPPPTPTQSAGQPLQDLFSARSVWPVRSDDATWRQVCGVSIVQVREGDPCIYTVMQRAGANPEAIDFLRRYGYFLAEFEEKGKVDYGVGSAPWVNMGRPTYQLALNGFPALQEVGGLIPESWDKDPRYADILRKDPQTFPWPTYGGIDSTRLGNNSSTIWTMSFRLAPCRACPDSAEIAIDIEWDKNGALDKVMLLSPILPR
jgi:hypothetical protein